MENRVMMALYTTFYHPNKTTKAHRRIENLHEELSQRLSRNNRKRVLRIIDLKDEIASNQSIESFILGFHLALVLSQELEQTGGYPFDFEE